MLQPRGPKSLPTLKSTGTATVVVGRPSRGVASGRVMGDEDALVSCINDAARAQDLGRLNVLLEGAGVDVLNVAFLVSAEVGFVGGMEAAVVKGGDARCTTPVGNCAAHTASIGNHAAAVEWMLRHDCLLYTSPSPRDLSTSRMPSSA